jgi:ankyrin repeat protein
MEERGIFCVEAASLRESLREIDRFKLCSKFLSSGSEVNVVDGVNILMHVASSVDKYAHDEYARSHASLENGEPEWRYSYKHKYTYSESFINSQRELVSLLLSHGVDINAVDSDGDTALIHALKVENKSLVLYLIDRGARVNAEWLIQASTHPELCSKFLPSGSEVNVVDGMNLLMHVASSVNVVKIDKRVPDKYKYAYSYEDPFINHQRELVSLLLSLGIEINAVDLHGKSALMYALEKMNMRIASYLVDCGARADTELLTNVLDADYGEYVREVDRLELCCKLLSAGADVNVVDSHGRNVLMCVIWWCPEEFIEKQRELVSLSLSCGIDLNAVDLDGWTALIYALKKNNSSIASYLIDNGIDLNVVDGTGKTALMYALDHRNTSIASCLVERGAHADAECFKQVLEDYNKYANEKVWIELCCKFLEAGVDANVVDSEGMNVLMHVASCYDKCDDDYPYAYSYSESFIATQRELVSLLLSCGVDINAVDKYGRTALEHTLAVKNLLIASYLIDCGARADVACFNKVWDSDYRDVHEDARLDLCSKLLSAVTDVNAVDSVGKNILMIVVSWFDEHDNISEELIKKQRELVSLILSYGIDINAVDLSGKTVLMYALDVGWDATSIVSCLIDCGACINLEYIRRVYGVAVDAASESDRIDLYRKLVSAWVDVKIGDTTGMNGLMRVASSDVSNNEKQ